MLICDQNLFNLKKFILDNKFLITNFNQNNHKFINFHKYHNQLIFNFIYINHTDLRIFFRFIRILLIKLKSIIIFNHY